MKNSLPQFTKEQLELLIVSLQFVSSKICDATDLAITIYDIDYLFEGMFGFKNSLDQRLLAYQPNEYSAQVFNPLIESLIKHREDSLA